VDLRISPVPPGPYAPWPALRAGRETLAVGGACLEATKDRRITPTVLPRPAAVPHQAGDFGPLHRGAYLPAGSYSGTPAHRRTLRTVRRTVVMVKAIAAS
jgi:hypothetical protein